jgi:hypothetical protein
MNGIAKATNSGVSSSEKIVSNLRSGISKMRWVGQPDGLCPVTCRGYSAGTAYGYSVAISSREWGVYYDRDRSPWQHLVAYRRLERT